MSIIKIPVKITTVVEDSIEVDLPCYTHVENTFYFVADTNKGQDVYISVSGTVIVSNMITVEKAFREGYKVITKSEYEEQFNKAIEILKSK